MFDDPIGPVDSNHRPADLIETGQSRRFFRVCDCARHHPSARTRPLDCLAQVAASLRWS